jgi:hypothetical protein
MTDKLKSCPSIFDLLEPLSEALLENGGPDIRTGFARATGGADIPYLVVAIAAYESAVTDIAKLGTVSLTSIDGHCVRIDFPNREDAERMYAALSGTGE